ncbi:MerR family DNA-binding transcriptional regulator [Candidatus Daviesbacteria bacterium]|nr:MerR family DNA-binding transcriptional regulator [Candidatus Daviesbacteria bacterium]
MNTTLPNNTSKKFIKIGEASKLLGVHIDTLRRWEAKGKIKSIRTPGRTRLYSFDQIKQVNQESLAETNPLTLNTEQLLDRAESQPEVTKDYDREIPADLDKSNQLDQISQNISNNSIKPTLISEVLFACLILLSLSSYFVLKEVNGQRSLILGLKQTQEKIANLIFPSHSSSPISKDAGLIGLNPNLVASKNDLNKGAVLAASASANFLELNSDSVINGSLAVSSDATFSGKITAPNVIYGLTPGSNITITQGQNPTISVSSIVSSLQGSTGAISLVAGTDISISGLTISNSSTLSSTRGRGGCDSCIKDSDVDNGLTISSSGSVDAGALTGTIASGRISGSYTGITGVGTIATGVWNGTVIGPTFGGTGLTSFTTGDTLYASATNTLSKLGIGTSGQVLTVSSGIPAWTTIGASSCPTCVLTNPSSSQTITNASSTGFTITQASTAGSADIFDVTNNAGTTKYLQIDSSGNASFAGTVTSSSTLTASNGLTQTTGALTLTATSGTLTLSGLSASSISFGSNNVTFTSGNFNTTSTGINSTAVGATTASTGAFTTLSATPGSDTTGLTVTGTNVTSANLVLLSAKNTSGNILAISYPSAATLATSGTFNALDFDIRTNVTATNANISGVTVKLPSVTVSSASTKNILGWNSNNTTQTLTTSNASAVGSYIGYYASNPAIVGTSGSASSYGFNALTGTITTTGTQAGFFADLTSSTVTTAGTVYGLLVNPPTTTSAGGTYYGASIGNITTSNGTDTAISIGTGWDADLAFVSTAPKITIGNTGTLSFTDGTNTLCSIADAGTTGNLTCSGNITGASTGTVGYWSRSGTTLSPATSGDAVTTSGNISTSGSGTITSASTLTASNGLTLTTGALSLTATSGSIALTGFGTTSITSTTTTGNINTLADSSFAVAAAATGNLVNLTFTNGSTSTSGTATTTGLNIAATNNAAGASGTHETYGIRLQNIAGTAGAGTQNNYGVRIGNYGQSSAETSYGLYVDAQSGSGTANYAAIFAGGNVGIGTTAPGAQLDILAAASTKGIRAQSSAASASSGNGAAAQNILDVLGATGQETTGTTGQTAGAGGSIFLTGGLGGQASGASGSNTGGLGGQVSIDGGAGGAATSGTSGAGGGVTIGGGNSDSSGGAGGAISISGGLGHGAQNGGGVNIVSGDANDTGNGGSITITSGLGGGTSGNSGTLTLDTGTVTSGTVGSVVINTGGVQAAAFNSSQNLTLNGTTITASSLTTLTTSSSLALNGASTITTNQASLTLFNATATTVSAFGAATTLSMATSNTASTLNLVTGTGGNTINIGSGTIATGNTQTIHLGDAATGTGKDVITIGNTNGASSLALNAGSGGITLTNATTTATTFASTTTNADKIAIAPSTGGSNSFTATISSADLTVGNQTFNFPDLAAATSATICVSGQTCASSGTLGYWSRSGTTLSPATANDIVSIANTTTSGADLAVTNTGIYTGTGLVNITANSATTGDILALSATALTSGSELVITGPSGGTAGVTDAAIKLTSDVGNIGTSNGLISSAATIDSTAASANGINLYLTTTNSNGTNANTAYGIYNSLSDAIALGNTNYGIYNNLSNTGVTSSNKTIYGNYSTVANTGATGGTQTTYGGYFLSDGDKGGTSTVYGVYARAGKYNGAGGGDNNYGGYFEGYNDSGTGTSLYGTYSYGLVGSGNVPNIYGAYNFGSFVGSGGSGSSMYGAYNKTTNDSANSFGTAYGSYNTVTDGGASNITTAYASYNLIDNQVSSTYTTAYGSYIGVTSSGTITTGYGLYINTIAGSTNYGLYQASSTNNNYFAGNVGIGTDTTPTEGTLTLASTSNTVPVVSLTNNTVTTLGAGVNTTGVLDLQSTTLTTGNFLNIETNALTTGKTVNTTSTSNAYTSGNLLYTDLTQSAATGTSVSGNIGSISFNPTYSTAITTPAISGNVLNIARSSTTNSSFASTLTVSGAVASISDTSTQTTGTLTNTANVLALTQNYSSATGNVLSIADSATHASGGSSLLVTANALTTGTGVSITSSSLTSGKLVSITPTFAGSAVTGYGLYNAGTDSTANANIDYGYYGSLALTGNAGKTGYGIYSTITNTSTTAATQYAGYFNLSNTGVVTATGDNNYGIYSSATRTGSTTAGTTNTYGGYFTTTADAGGASTTNAYGIYATATGGDNNYAGYFDVANTGQVYINSTLSGGARSVPQMTITQANAGNSSSSNLLELINLDQDTAPAPLDIDNRATLPTFINLHSNAAVALSGSSATGINVDLKSNYSISNATTGVVAYQGTLPSNTSTCSGCTFTYQGLEVSQTTLSQSTNASTHNSNLVDLTLPNITQTTGTITANGVLATNGTITTAGTENSFKGVLGTITTAGTQNGVNIDFSGSTITTAGTVNGVLLTPPTTTSTGGTYNGINIGNITTSNGTDTAISIGTGWDTGILGAGALTIKSTSGDLGLSTVTSGNITLAPASTGSVQLTSGVTTGTTTSSALSIVANSLSSGTGFNISSSANSLTGSLTNISSTGTTAGINANSAGGSTGTAQAISVSNLAADASNFSAATSITFTNVSSNTTGTSAVSGYTIIGTINATGASGAKTASGTSVVAPTLTGCGSGTSTCTWNGVGSSLTNLGGGFGGFTENAFNVNSATATSGTIRGINLVGIGSPGAGTEIAINASAGWDTILNVAGAFTQAASSTDTGVSLDFSSMTAAVGSATNLTGTTFLTPAITETGNFAHTYLGYDIPTTGNIINQGTSTFAFTGYDLSGSGTVTQNTAAGTINWRGVNINLPAITQTTGTITADGVRVLIPATGSITTGGTMNGINVVAPTTNSNAAGTLNGVNIANLTVGTGGTGNNALTIGSGWGKQINGNQFSVDGSGILTLDLATTSSNGVCHTNSGTGTAEVLLDCTGTITDYAEVYATTGNSEPGDILATTDQPLVLDKSNSSYQQNIIGAISTNPNDPIGQTFATNQNPQPIGLSGRIPIKVSLENGPIKKGDLLTTSSTLGVAMKATHAGMVIGTALEDFDGSVKVSADTLSQENHRLTDHPDYPVYHSDPAKWPEGVGKISVLARVSFADPANLLASLAISSDGTLITHDLTVDKITINSKLELNGTLVVNGTNVDPQALITAGNLASSVDDLNSTIATQSGQLANLSSQVAGVATQSANLAQNLASESASLANLNSQVSQVSSSSASLTTQVASNSAQIAAVQSDLDLIKLKLNSTDSSSSGQLISLNVQEATVSGIFRSLGDTFLAKTNVAGDITQDGTLSIEGGKSINALPTLYFQNSLIAETVDFFNGLITFDKTGKVTLQKLVIPDTKLATLNSDPTIGSGKIISGQTSVIINNNQVSSTAKIFVTARSKIGSQALVVESVNPGNSFIVSLDHALGNDLIFDWWIVETK